MSRHDWEQIEKKFEADGWKLEKTTKEIAAFSSNATFTTSASIQNPDISPFQISFSPMMIERNLIIDRAVYGANDVWKDVTDLLRSKIFGDKLEIIVSNAELEGDPCPDMPKELKVSYSYHGRKEEKVIPETPPGTPEQRANKLVLPGPTS